MTIVGDWFVAESKIPQKIGYRQTKINWHTPTVWRRVCAFDDEFKKLHRTNGKSRLEAMDEIALIIKKLSKPLK